MSSNNFRIYDATMFFNEREMLLCRYTKLLKHVHFQLFVEGNYTFSGNYKQPSLCEVLKSFPNDGRVNFCVHSINTRSVYWVIKKFLKGTGVAWKYEASQRSHLLDCLRHTYMPSDEDLVLIGDIDEIPSDNAFVFIHDNYERILSSPHTLEMSNHFFSPTLIFDQKWAGTVICSFKDLRKMGPVKIRSMRNQFPIVKDSGWHLSFFMPPPRMAEKIEAFSHQEFNHDKFKDPTYLMLKITRQEDPFGLGRDLKIISGDNPIIAELINHIVSYDLFDDYLSPKFLK